MQRPLTLIDQTIGLVEANALATVLDRRKERTERRREHISELNKRATEAGLRLKRLYDAIETGVADLGDPGLKDRIAGLQAIRDQAQADTIRAQAMLDSAAQRPVTTAVLRKFAATARKRMRIEGGGISPGPSARPGPTG